MAHNASVESEVSVYDSQRGESNPRSGDYEAGTLPTSPRCQRQRCNGNYWKYNKTKVKTLHKREKRQGHVIKHTETKVFSN